MSMIHINGAKSQSTITNLDKSCVQPNAIDLRLGKVFRILPTEFTITEESKIHRKTEEVVPDAEGYYCLEPGSYEVAMDHVVTVAEHEAGWVITRSTLNRNGVFLTSGLYDSKYNGAMAGCMHVTSGIMRIRQGTRIGQFLTFDAEMLHAYNGDYGFDESGSPKAMEAKYHK